MRRSSYLVPRSLSVELLRWTVGRRRTLPGAVCVSLGEQRSTANVVWVAGNICNVWFNLSGLWVKQKSFGPSLEHCGRSWWLKGNAIRGRPSSQRRSPKTRSS